MTRKHNRGYWQRNGAEHDCGQARDSDPDPNHAHDSAPRSTSMVAAVWAVLYMAGLVMVYSGISTADCAVGVTGGVLIVTVWGAAILAALE